MSTPIAVRTWDRDQSRNVMPLDAAVANIVSARKGHDEFEQLSADEVRAALQLGERISTPRATFRLGTGEKGRGRRSAAAVA